MQQLVLSVHHYFQSRLDGEPIPVLNEIIRELRIMLQQVLLDHFLPLPVEKGRQFRVSLADHLSGVCRSFDGKGGAHDEAHHRYCMQEVLACFEWAEQIKLEVPHDPITQKVLSVDIPILRPFNYGLKIGKIPHKK